MCIHYSYKTSESSLNSRRASMGLYFKIIKSSLKPDTSNIADRGSVSPITNTF